jgi:glycosyltransferase involved in cell wall biosynthesis
MVLLSFKKPVFYVECPTAWEVVKKLNPQFLIYQRTDIFEETPGGNKSYIESLNNALTSKADLILYVNTALWREGKKKNANSLLIGHGVDFEQFANAEQTKYVPEDIAKIPRPIIGFFGDITEDYCDFSLLEHTAKILPNMSLVIVGPISSDVSNLQGYKNVFFLGQKPYEEIPHYGKAFDVAIMPWKRNKWIEFCNPVKTKEYLALGKPIVSIEYPELRPYADVVYAALNPDEFVNKIQEALAENDLDLKRRRRERVMNETWDNKVKRIVEFIEENLKEESHGRFYL